MSSKISALASLASVQADDVVPVVDVHDTSMASSGTTKKITALALTGVTVTVPQPTGATAADTAAVTGAITRLTSALASGPATLLFPDGTYQVDSSALLVQNCSNFTIRGSGATVISQAPNRAGNVNNVTGNLLSIADCTDFRVEGLTLDGLRDTVAPMTPLTAAASSGQPSVTVAAGQGSRYLAGQKLFLFGGLGTAEQNQQEGFATAGAVNPLVISSITTGGGSGGGDLITFTASLGSSYAQISSSAFSDGFGPYAYAGAYLTPYQCGSATVAGRTLFGEDQQNGLHLLSCQRFTVAGVTARNLWESPVRLGTGYGTTSLTDGCQQGTITDCTGYHAYDQGVAVWVSQNITVKGCVMNATGWAGVSLTASDYCTVTANQIVSPVYRVPGDAGSGSGIVTEGGLRGQISGNIINSPHQYGIETIHSPLTWGLNNASLPTTSTFLEAGTAAGTSIQISATAAVQAGGRYSLLDGPRTEAVTVASVVDGTHVTFSETLAFSHATATPVGARVAQENVVTGNTIRGAGSQGIMLTPSVRGVIKDNTVTGSGSYAIAPDFTVGFRPNTSYPAGDGTHLEGNIIGNGAGAGIRANGVTQLQVRGNRIHSPGASGGGIELHGTTDSVISENYITDVVGSFGIVAESGGPSSTPSARLTISGNSVHRTQLQGICAILGDSYTITGNVVQSCRSNGIDLQGVTRSVVQANVANSNSATGILLEDSGAAFCMYNRVIGNTARDDGTGISVVNGTAITQQHGIVETGSSNFNVFIGNETDSNAVDQLTTAGAGSYVFANTVSGTVAGALAVALGGTGVASLTAYGLLAGGTSSTGALQQIAAGTSGNVLTSNGAGVLPSFQPGGGGSFPGFDATAAHILADTTQGAGANGLAADSGHVHPATTWVPADNSLLGAVADPYTYRQGQITTAGTVYLIKLPVRLAQTISFLWWSIAIAGAGASTGSFTGLYSSAGTLLTGSSDIAASLTGTGTPKLTLTTPQAVAAGAFVWAAILINLATTQPSLASATTPSHLLNANLAASAYRVAVNGTGQTSLPGSINPNSNVLTGAFGFWAGWS